MNSDRPASSFRALWLIACLALRRQRNVWRNMRLGRKKSAPATPAPGAAARRSATPAKSRRSVYSIFILLVMWINGFNIASTGLKKISDTVMNRAQATDRIRVSPYTQHALLQAAEALRALQQARDPAERRQSQQLWNADVDRLLREEVQRHYLSPNDQREQLRRMRAAFSRYAAAGFEASGAVKLHASAETWPRGGEGQTVFLRVVALVMLLWFSAIIFLTLGTSNKDLGKVEWTLEWLYTFPVPARVLFVSKLFDYSFFNPPAWFFFLPFVIVVYFTGGQGWNSLPLGLAAFIWILIVAGAVTTVGEVAARKFLSVSRLKNLQALCMVLSGVFTLLALVSCISKPLQAFLVSRAIHSPALVWNPCALPLYLGMPSATLGQILLGVGGMAALAGGGVCAALLGSEWLTRDGLIRASGPYQGSRKIRPAQGREGWLQGIPALELRLLARDRNLLVQVLIVPVLLPAVYLLAFSGLTSTVTANMRNAELMAFFVGAYSFLNSAMPVLNREDKTLWYLLSVPQSLPSILFKKVTVWAAVGLLYGGAVLFLIVRFGRVQGENWGDVFFALYGVVLYAFIASGIGILATNVLATTPRARFRTDMVYLYLILAAAWANTIYSPSLWAKLAQLVISTLLALALWQKVADASSYLLDPTERPPSTLALADGMIAILAFFVVQGLIALGLQWVAPEPWTVQTTIAYAFSGVIVGGVTLLILWRRKIPDLWERIGLTCGKSQKLTVWRSLGEGSVWGGIAAMGALAYLGALKLFPQWQYWKHSAELKTFLTRGDNPLWICALAILAAPLFEEFLFRGLIFRGLLRSTGPAAAVLGSAALFALAHPPLSVIPIFGLGIAAALSFRKSSHLLAPIAAHAVYNTCVIVLNRL